MRFALVLTTGRTTLSLAAVGLAVIVSAPAAAQTPPAQPLPNVSVRPVQDPAQQLIDEQRQRAQQRQLAQPPVSIAVPPQSPETTLEIPLDTPVARIPETGPVFRVDEIEVSGNTVLSKSKIEAITAPFVGQQLGSHRVNVLLKRLTDAFVSAGYITTRAILGPQNLASGTLKVVAMVGHIEGYTLNGQSIHRLKKDETSSGGGLLTDAGYDNAFPASPGQPLNIDDLNQGVTQINRMRRNQAAVQILPGQSAGDSMIAIANQPGESLYYTFGVDNYGSSSTGVTRYRAGVEADNLIGLQEVMSLNFVDSLESNAVVGSIAVPFGRNTFSYTLSDSEYQQVIGTSALLYGRTLSHIVGWNYALVNNSAGSASIDTTLSWRRTDREVNDVELDPQHIAVLRVGSTWLSRFALNGAPGNLTFNAGISEGLPWLEADHDAQDVAKSDAHSQFTKLDATVAVTVPLPKFGPGQFAYRGVLSGQLTNVALFGSEQLYLGGMDTIRGFRSGELVGDRGFYSRNEIAWTNLPAWHDGRVEPYVFLDAGKASLIAVPGFPALAGVGAGLRAQWQWNQRAISGEVTVGRALTQPASLGPRATLVLATANLSF